MALSKKQLRYPVVTFQYKLESLGSVFRTESYRVSYPVLKKYKQRIRDAQDEKKTPLIQQGAVFTELIEDMQRFAKVERVNRYEKDKTLPAIKEEDRATKTAWESYVNESGVIISKRCYKNDKLVRYELYEDNGNDKTIGDPAKSIFAIVFDEDGSGNHFEDENGKEVPLKEGVAYLLNRHTDSFSCR
jgi:hypothetical protein